MNIIDFLIEEHEKMRRQLVVIRQCLSQACLRDKVEGFVKEYKLHESIEDKVLFPPLIEIFARSPEKKAVVVDFEQSHRDIWKSMKHLTEALDRSRHEVLRQAFFEFCASTESHLGQEERTLFPMIRDNVQVEVLDELGSRAEACRKVAEKSMGLTHPFTGSESLRKPDRILVPLDFSQASAAALDMAALIAGHTGSELILLSVEHWPIDAGYPAPPIPPPDPKDCESRLEKLFRERQLMWPEDPVFPYGHRLKTMARIGNAADEILNVAKETGADMIVMGTHGRRGISRAILGSVTEQVIRRASCPVLAIRATMPMPDRDSAAAPSREVLA